MATARTAHGKGSRPPRAIMARNSTAHILAVTAQAVSAVGVQAAERQSPIADHPAVSANTNADAIVGVLCTPSIAALIGAQEQGDRREEG
jgi:hypothetical protein